MSSIPGSYGTSVMGASTGGTAAAPDASTGTQARAPAPLQEEFVQVTTQRLATVYLGPIARVVARKAAEKARSQEEFLQIVAGHIGTQDRAAFLRDVGFELE